MESSSLESKVLVCVCMCVICVCVCVCVCGVFVYTHMLFGILSGKSVPGVCMRHIWVCAYTHTHTQTYTQNLQFVAASHRSCVFHFLSNLYFYYPKSSACMPQISCNSSQKLHSILQFYVSYFSILPEIFSLSLHS